MKSLNSRPLKEINTLCRLLVPAANKVCCTHKIRASSTYSFFILLEGEVYLHVKAGVMLPISAPMILGLGGLCGSHRDVTLSRSQVDVVLMEVLTHTAQAIVDHAGMWKPVACVISYNMGMYNDYFSLLVHNDTYNVIRKCILLIDDMRQRSGKKVLVAKFIVESTGLSRSAVMKMLASLKKGGYIQIENGFLVRLLRLPAKY